MWRYGIRILMIPLLFILLAPNGFAGSLPPLVHISGRTMGTSYHISFYGMRPISIHDEIERLLVRINEQMSTYLEDSEISRFNRAEAGVWFPVSRDFAQVVADAKQMHALSGGSFEPTIEPLVNLWGFGPMKMPNKVPATEVISDTLTEIGMDKVQVKLDPPSLRKEHKKVEIDLSAMAKGFGVDKVALFLESIGLDRYMVEIGGEVRVGRKKPDGLAWMIGIQMPEDGGGLELARILKLEQGSVATSGDYRNYYEKDGKRYSHIIDPLTGFPIKHKLASVTVVTKRCADADALATAFMVMGSDKGLDLAKEQSLAVLFVVRDGGGGGFRQILSPAMSAYVK